MEAIALDTRKPAPREKCCEIKLKIGPTINPNPKVTAPNKPNALARPSAGVTSDTMA